jgi:hypothetical protein
VLSRPRREAMCHCPAPPRQKAALSLEMVMLRNVALASAAALIAMTASVKDASDLAGRAGFLVAPLAIAVCPRREPATFGNGSSQSLLPLPRPAKLCIDLTHLRLSSAISIDRTGETSL